MSKCKLHPEYLRQKALQEALLARKNRKSDFYNGIYDRWEYPVLTREHIPLEWRFDLDPTANPYFMERLGVNAVFNAGAIELDGKFYLVARVDSITLDMEKASLEMLGFMERRRRESKAKTEAGRE